MLWNKILRSPHAHAHIHSINTSQAESLPNIKAIMTTNNIINFPTNTPIPLSIQNMHWICHNMIAQDKALWHGHTMATIAATSKAIAAETCKLIKVDYKVLPHMIEIDNAIAPDTPILHNFIKFENKPSNITNTLKHTKNNITTGFAKTNIIIKREFTTRPVHQSYIKPHAYLMSMTANNKTTI